MNEPLVSVIVPCYNQALYLNEALQSVLNQTYTNWECIIVNDGSPDFTEEVAIKWLEKDCRFKYIKKVNGGLSAARNSGIGIAQGEFILPLDADDKISTIYIELAVKTFIKDDSIKVVYSKAEKFGDELGKWNLEPFTLRALALDNMIFCSALFKKIDWVKVGGYDNMMVFGLEDWEFWIALLKNGGNVKQLDIVGFYYRIKGVSMSKQIDQEKGNYLLDYLSVKHADFFVKQYGSFKNMERKLMDEKNKNEINLKSEKFVIDVFCKRFFGFSVFGKYK